MHLLNHQYHDIDKRISSVHLKHKTLDQALISIRVVSTSDVRAGATTLHVRVTVKIIKIPVPSKFVEAPTPKLVQNLM